MNRTFLFTGLLLIALVACSPATTEPPAPATSAPTATEAPPPTEQPTATPTPMPFPMSDSAFSGEAQDFIVSADEVDGAYTAANEGFEVPNSSVIDLRSDGALYVLTTGRRGGWQIQYNRTGDAETPPYFVNVVTIFDDADGASLALSRDWHTDVWARIDSGELEQLPEIPGLDAEQLVWRDASGSVGVEIVYRNLYLFFIGPPSGGDDYAFFANLVQAHLAWIQAREP